LTVLVLTALAFTDFMAGDLRRFAATFLAGGFARVAEAFRRAEDNFRAGLAAARRAAAGRDFPPLLLEAAGAGRRPALRFAIVLVLSKP